jgi:N-acyl-D-amino-acid deacylase
MKYRFVLLLALLVALIPLGLHAQTYDVVIRHGRVVDGSGNPAFFADVAVKD